MYTDTYFLCILVHNANENNLIPKNVKKYVDFFGFAPVQLGNDLALVIYP